MAGNFAYSIIANRPGGSDLTAWYAFPATSGFVVLAALAVFGFVVAMGGRALVGDESFER